MAGPPAAGWQRLGPLTEALLDDVAVEPKPAPRATQADRPQVLGVFINPVTLDTQLARQGCGVREFDGGGLLQLPQQLDHPARDRLDDPRADTQLGAAVRGSPRYCA
jgi:hypothetical protein